MRALASLSLLALASLARIAHADRVAAPAAPAPSATPTAAATGDTGDDLRAQARARSELGKRHYELGDYGAAIADYRAAYLLLPSAGVLFNLGQAYRMRGDCAAAAGAYRSFLRSGPSGPARQLASEQLPAVDACARAAESSSARRDRRLRTAGLFTGGAGVVALAAAGFFAYDAHQAELEVESGGRRGGRWSDLAEADARGQRASTLAVGFAIGGGALVATGAALYLLGRHRAPSEDANLWVAPTRTAAVVGASWAW